MLCTPCHTTPCVTFHSITLYGILCNIGPIVCRTSLQTDMVSGEDLDAFPSYLPRQAATHKDGPHVGHQNIGQDASSGHKSAHQERLGKYRHIQVVWRYAVPDIPMEIRNMDTYQAGTSSRCTTFAVTWWKKWGDPLLAVIVQAYRKKHLARRVCRCLKVQKEGARRYSSELQVLDVAPDWGCYKKCGKK